MWKKGIACLAVAAVAAWPAGAQENDAATDGQDVREQAEQLMKEAQDQLGQYMKDIEERAEKLRDEYGEQFEQRGRELQEMAEQLQQDVRRRFEAWQEEAEEEEEEEADSYREDDDEFYFMAPMYVTLMVSYGGYTEEYQVSLAEGEFELEWLREGSAPPMEERVEVAMVDVEGEMEPGEASAYYVELEGRVVIREFMRHGGEDLHVHEESIALETSAWADPGEPALLAKRGETEIRVLLAPEE